MYVRIWLCQINEDGSWLKLVETYKMTPEMRLDSNSSQILFRNKIGAPIIGTAGPIGNCVVMKNNDIFMWRRWPE